MYSSPALPLRRSLSHYMHRFAHSFQFQNAFVQPVWLLPVYSDAFFEAVVELHLQRVLPVLIGVRALRHCCYKTQ